MAQKIKTEIDHPFQRLQSELTTLITSAQPGDKLPSEPELAKQLRVSRATLREAMRSFEGQGLIRRRQGKGTFVVSHTKIIETGLEVLESIETQAKRIHLDVSMGNLKITKVQIDAEQADELRVPEGTDAVIVSRVILAENRPVAYLIDLLPESMLMLDDLQEGFTGSVLDRLLQRGTPSLANSLSEIQAVAAPSDIARALQIQRGDVLLKFFSRLMDTSGHVVDFSESYFLPGYFHFHVVRRVGGASII
jgi:GntR family transcriptional regulator